MTGYQHHAAQRAPGRAGATLDRIAANLERTENLLAAILDTLVAMRPEQMPKRMPTMQGAHYAAAFPPAFTEKAPLVPYGTPTGLFNRDALMAALPLPPKRGDGIYRVAGPSGELPDSAGTPGAINPDVTEATLKATIGTPGWTARVRPSTAFTDALKAQISAEYGLTGSLSEYECDHLIPLCCGGHPTSQQNLWNQRRAGVNGAPLKDITEVLAQHAILAGHISLQEAQDGFRRDWTALHARLTSNPQVMRLMMAMEPPDEEP